MIHATYAISDTYPIAILVKNTAYHLNEIDKLYVQPLKAAGISSDDVIIVSLPYNDNNKAPVKFIKENLSIILEALNSVGTKTIYCADAGYFKILANAKKADPHLGNNLPCAVKGYEHFTVVLGINHKSIIYDPKNADKLMLSMTALISTINGDYEDIGKNIIGDATYPNTLEDIKAALDKLHAYPELAIDIEAGSLDFDKAGVGTITFCWNQSDGIAFAIDWRALDQPVSETNGHYGELVVNKERRALVKAFLTEYQGATKWHYANYDLKVLIYELWMQDGLDREGLLTGLDVLTRNFHDTKIISYLATNSAAGNHLSLKEQAHEFAGNWAQSEIKDIRKIPYQQLLEYNLVDGLATNYTYAKHYPTLIADKQLEVYDKILMPGLKTLIDTELTGMPMSKEMIPIAKQRLQTVVDEQIAILAGSPVIKKFNLRLQKEAMLAANAKLKVKQHALAHFDTPQFKFNPGSPLQKVKLIYEEMQLPVQYRTKTKKPSTKGKHVKYLVNHTKNADYLEVLNALLMFTTADKILSTFIPSFEKALDKGDGVLWLHGSFNLGGTKSGRLSSSGPNMQNIPSGSLYAKLIKMCFVAPEGWIFGGADFNSLEDYISALTTKDTNKLKVYTDGYDGHCLRAFKYFPEQLPGITDTVESINSIQTLFPNVRQDSKAPTFALTYQGMWITLMNNLGWTEQKSKRIEANFRDLYKESIAWVDTKLDEASKSGYVELAFGLRLRTPLLAQTIKGYRPFAAEAEGRTAGNALGQSYGLLNTRAANAFMEKARASKYRLDIKSVAQIHDAIYLVWRNDLEVTEWVNRELIKAMQWQDLPELHHPTVKLGAGLSIFWPSWKDEIHIPNGATGKETQEICKAYKEAYEAKEEAA